MPVLSFVRQLLITLAACATPLGLLWWLSPGFRPLTGFAGMTLLLFTLISAVLYALGRMTARKQGQAFLGVVLISSFAKMAVTLAFLAWFKYAFKPEGSGFLGVFLFVYGVFGFFEVHFMTQIGKATPALPKP
ncbi:MAG: hypothetical protein SFV52_10645 [Saprospiraceae bacterium]|nr:hypothetical protein [Saprospiraceae bacterium]